MIVEIGVAVFLVSSPLIVWSVVRLEAWHRRRCVADFIVRYGAGRLVAEKLEHSFLSGFTYSAESVEPQTLTFKTFERDLEVAGVRPPLRAIGRSISGSIPVDWEPGSAQRLLARLGPSWPSRDRDMRGRQSTPIPWEPDGLAPPRPADFPSPYIPLSFDERARIRKVDP